MGPHETHRNSVTDPHGVVFTYFTQQGIEMKKRFVHILVVTLLLPATASIAQQKMDDIKGIDTGRQQAAATQSTHTAVAVVRRVDAKAGTVTLAHEPVKSLNWSAMTMGFKVTDRSLLDKLSEGKKVEVEFKQAGKDYVITAVK
jgi:Cu(I)/Ag(I) efflux system protein CusF